MTYGDIPSVTYRQDVDNDTESRLKQGLKLSTGSCVVVTLLKINLIVSKKVLCPHFLWHTLRQ